MRRLAFAVLVLALIVAPDALTQRLPCATAGNPSVAVSTAGVVTASITWTATGCQNGPHVLDAVVRDAAGNLARHAIPIKTHHTGRR